MGYGGHAGGPGRAGWSPSRVRSPGGAGAKAGLHRRQPEVDTRALAGRRPSWGALHPLDTRTLLPNFLQAPLVGLTENGECQRRPASLVSMLLDRGCGYEELRSESAAAVDRGVRSPLRPER